MDNQVKVKMRGADCPHCPLASNQIVPPKIIPGGKRWLMIVGESPGRTEVIKGKPFVGPSGRFLHAMLRASGILHTHSFIVTNAILCAGKPELGAAMACRGHIRRLVRKYKPEAIIALGATAVFGLTGEEVKITKVVGYTRNFEGVPVVMCTHPAYALRNPTAANDLWAVLNQVKAGIKQIRYDAEGMIVSNLDPIERVAVPGATLALDVETDNEGNLIALGIGNHTTAYTMTRATFDEYKDELRALFDDESITWVAHNAPFDFAILERHGIPIPKNIEDTIAIHYTTFDERPAMPGLEGCAVRHLGANPWKHLVKPYIGKGKSFADIPTPVLHRYLAQDVVYTAGLYQVWKDKRSRPYHIMLDAIPAIAHMQANGMRIDRTALEEEIVIIREEQAKIKERLAEITGRDKFNPNSHVQVSDVLYNEMEAPVIRVTPKGNPATDATTMLEVAAICSYDERVVEFVRLLKEFRNASKVLSTYLIGLKKRLVGDVYYPNINQVGTVSGRWTEPWALLLPRTGTNRFTRRLRNLVIPPEGHALIVADFDQLELRVLAVEANIIPLLDAFREGRDPHGETTALIYGEDWHAQENAAELRTRGKTANFAAAYGGGVNAIIEATGVDSAEAERIILRFYQAYPQILDWKQGVIEGVEKRGFAETRFGFRRRFPLYLAGRDNLDLAVASAIEREATNFIIQSSAFTLMLLALPRLLQVGRLYISVHDSIILTVPEQRALGAAKQVADIMSATATEAYDRVIPFTVETKVGPSWGEAKVV